jgi:DNA polymerase III subunit delta'
MRGADNSVSENPIPPPRANPHLVGHGAAERELLRLYHAGRLPHALLVTGPRGIGKATLAFRLARFLLAQSSTGEEPGAAVLAGFEAEAGLAIDPSSGIFRRVAAGGHADLLTVERAWDPRRRRLRGEIVVEDTREIAAFFRLSAAEEGWRIVIVDGAEEMNRNAANALLKILEEPPDRGLLLLVSHNPGRLLPTIRSRCRLVLVPLPTPLAAELLRRYRPQLDEAEAVALSVLSGGSVGRALELAEAGGLELYRSLTELLAQVPAIDLGRLHALTDRLARAEAEDAYRASEELLARFLARLAADMARGRAGAEEIVAGEGAAISRLAGAADAARWAELRSEIERNFATARNLNLDRKQTMLGAFFAIEALAR